MFLTAKISPNGDPKVNLLTLSKGFFMKIFNNFGKKKKVMFGRVGGGFLYGCFEDHHLGHFGYLSI
jgi:hypothetical protein